jgi:hypothetical protein
MMAVRRYLGCGLSYRDVEELLAERGITVDHVTIHRRVQQFTPLLIDAARLCRHAAGDRWLVERCSWRDVCEGRRGGRPAVLHPRPRARPVPDRSDHDQAPAYPRVIEELTAAACHVTKLYAKSRRSRSLTSASPAAVVAWCETAALGTGDQCRARVRAEPPAAATTNWAWISTDGID